MPIEDANRWNSRYQTDPGNTFNHPRSLLQDHTDLLPTSGLALDIAMGLGGNANFLIKHGIRVIGVDISYVAVRRAKNRLPALAGVVADLEQFYIPYTTFDVILNFLYLQPSLWLPIINGLKIGGVLFIECLTVDMLSIHPEINPAYLLKHAELEHSFLSSEYSKIIEILYYSEGWYTTPTSHPRSTACLIARRIV